MSEKPITLLVVYSYTKTKLQTDGAGNLIRWDYKKMAEMSASSIQHHFDNNPKFNIKIRLSCIESSGNRTADQHRSFYGYMCDDPEIDYVLALDVDTLVYKNITELLERFIKSGKRFAGRVTGKLLVNSHFMNRIFQDYGLVARSTLVNNVFIMRGEDCRQICELSIKWTDTLIQDNATPMMQLFLNDQVGLSMALSEMGIYNEDTYFFNHYNEVVDYPRFDAKYVDDISIIHFGSKTMINLYNQDRLPDFWNHDNHEGNPPFVYGFKD